MKAVILAAGMGTRLRPIETPKCLLKVGGKTILVTQIENLRACGLNEREIIVVVGYKPDEIIKFCKKRFNGLKFVINPLYEITDNLYSCWLACKELQDEFVCLNADVCFDVEILRNLLKIKKHFCIVTSDGRKQKDIVKVNIENGLVKEIGKGIRAEKEFIGLSKFSTDGAKIFFNELNQLPSQMRKSLYYALGIQMLIDSGYGVYE